MRKLTFLLLLMVVVLFAYANWTALYSAEGVHNYSRGTAKALGSTTDDTLTIFTAKPCTTAKISVGRFTDLIVTSWDAMNYIADDTTDDSCIYYIIWCTSPYVPSSTEGCLGRPPASGSAALDTGLHLYERVDSTAAYSTFYSVGGGSTWTHPLKVFSDPSGVMVGHDGFFIVQPITKCDSCDVQITYILRQE